MKLLILAAALAITPASGDDLALSVWTHCSEQHTMQLRQRCIETHIQIMQSIVSRVMLREPERAAACRAVTDDRLVAMVACLATEGTPL